MADRYVAYVSKEQQQILRHSDYDLLQLHAKSVWQMMVHCILLNCTRRKQVDKVRDQLFDTWKSASAMSIADYASLEEMLKPLGFAAKRADTLIRFSHQYCLMRHNDGGYDALCKLTHMRGIGDYALDAYAIFQLGHINIRPKDKELLSYVAWLGADLEPKKKRYLLIAGPVESKNDGDRHWVTAKNLQRLYNLDIQECVLIESEYSLKRYQQRNNTAGLIELRPLYSGKYHEAHQELMKARNDQSIRQ